jgi:transcriptional regulator GlxA family with amidase domain
LFLPADAALCVIDSGLIAGVAPRRIQIRSGSTGYVAGLLALAESLLDGDPISQQRDKAQAMDDALRERIRFAIQASNVLISEASSRNLRTWAVERACRYIGARLTKSISLAALSRHCGVGIRTLEYSFRQFYDTTPVSFIKSQRLTRTHNALVQPDARATTISKIARRSGFSHMGQYCQDYRALFGESPSMTLQRASRSEQAVGLISSAPTT